MTTVAFLGIGAMGAPMARRLVEGRHQVRVWNRTPGRDSDVVAAGAIGSSSPADAARDAQVVITMLADPTALEEVVFGTDGIAAGIRPEATLIEMSTVGRSAILALAPVAMLDAPVLGSTPHAKAGNLTILVGGSTDTVAEHADLLGLLGTVRHVGPLGAGATVTISRRTPPRSLRW